MGFRRFPGVPGFSGVFERNIDSRMRFDCFRRVPEGYRSALENLREIQKCLRALGGVSEEFQCISVDSMDAPEHQK